MAMKPFGKVYIFLDSIPPGHAPAGFVVTVQDLSNLRVKMEK
jgi:hypothetical protein